MGPPLDKDDKCCSDGEHSYQIPPPPACWPAADTARSPSSSINNNTGKNNSNSGTRSSTSSTSSSSSSSRSSRGNRRYRGDPSPPEVANLVPSWSGFDEDFEVELPGRRNTSFFVRVAGRKLAATNGVAVVIHGGGFTGMSWAPAAGVMKRDCCVIAPDLRGHGLTTTSSNNNNTDDDGADADSGTDDNIDANARKGARQEDYDDTDASAGGGYDSGNSGGGDGKGDLMSLESLAEDVKSLLVEIFTSGVLFQPNLPRRQQQQRQQQQSEPPVQQHQQSKPLEQQDAGPGGEEQQQQQQQQQPFRTGPPPPMPPSRQPIEEVNDDPATLTGKNDAIPASAEAPATESNRGCSTREPAPTHSPKADGSSSSGCLDGSPIKLLLVGHSLGGCIAVRVAGAAEEVKRRCGRRVEVAGVVAVDVVEGTALAALEDMPEVLRKIPRSFPSMEEAVLWHVKTGAMRSSASAHAVVPSRLKKDQDGDRVVWRTDLRATQRHWRGWFEGMSAAFLGLPVPKLLVVAGMDRLDTELTAAHMQGRFQLKMVYGCGHSVQEDQPGETAASIINFARRNSIIRRGKNDGSGPAGEDEELRLKLARARVQANLRNR